MLQIVMGTDTLAVRDEILKQISKDVAGRKAGRKAERKAALKIWPIS